MSHHHHTPEVHDHADAWHRHSAEEGMPQVEHAGTVSPFALIKAFVAIVGTVAVLVIVLSMYYTHTVTQVKAEQMETDRLAAEWNSTRAGWDAALSSYAPVGDSGWRIPIDKAMDRVINRYEARGGTKPSK